MKTTWMACTSLASFCIALGACSNAPVAGDTSPPKEKQYRTGSNLPVGDHDRSGVTVVDKDVDKTIIRPITPIRLPGSTG